jgi:Protein of unknown function (DUF5663)
MIKLDDNLLQELGLGSLPAGEKDKFLRHIYETLEMRVGTRLAERMTDAQLDEFESFIDRRDDQGAFHWLETNFPNYKEVVAEEFEKLKREIKAVAPDILSASQTSAASAQPPQDYTPPADAPAAQPYMPPNPPAGPAPTPSPFAPPPDQTSQPAQPPQY